MFLGPKTPGNKQHPNFPICTKGTCRVNPKGLYAAYIRANSGEANVQHTKAEIILD